MNETLHVLVVEDNPADVDLIREALPETGPMRFHVECVPRLCEALGRLAAGGIDLVLIDLGLPDSQGLGTFRKLRQAASDLAMIVLTGNDDQQIAVTAVREGAQDYLVKGEMVGSVLMRAARYAMERKQAEESLRKERTRLYEVLETLPAMICLLTPDYHVTFANRSFRDKFGESHGRHCYDHCFGRTEPCESCETYTVLETGKPRHWEVTSPDGGSIIDVYDFPFTDADGSPLILEMDIDITERKRAEHDLLASETRYRRFFESARDGILILDAGTGKIMDINPFLADLLGFDHEYFLGKKLWEIGSFKDIAASEAAFLELQGKGYIRYENLPLETRDGRRIEVEFVSNVYLADSTKVVQCNIRDITDRKRVEEERRRLAMAVNQAAESIIITDGQGVIQYVNPAFERTAGYSRDELMGRNIVTLSSAEHHDSILDREVVETLERGDVWRGRIVTYRKDGSEFTAETSISPVRDIAGNIVSRVAISRDITNEILLESRVRQAQKMEAIGTLAGGIAHDFNNVLAAIIGYGQMAASDLAPDNPLQKDLAQVLCAADRAKNLVRQILTFSRQAEEERRPIELGLIVNEALQLLRPSLPTTIEIRTHIDNDSGPVLADPTQAHQVVMNLCTNAYHAMRDTGGVLTLSVEPFQAYSHLIQSHPGLHEGPYVRLSVGDTGCGMDKDVQERIFEPFFTTKAQSEGTGLGLATVHGIVSAHGGVITVYSEVGKGSTFRVYLPCAEPGLPELLLLEKPVQGGHEHILVLDDEEALANLMERMLTPLGYDVVAMTNSADALAAFTAYPHLFDLIVTDQTMPKMTGEQLAVEVRRIRPDMPVILTTGFTGGALRERLTGIGVSAVLAKPVEPLEMARVVRQVLDGHFFKGKTIQDPASV